MNNKRRELLKSVVILLDRASSIVNNALEQEQDCLDNMPENLQMSERYENMEAAVDYLEEAASHLDDARSRIVDASV